MVVAGVTYDEMVGRLAQFNQDHLLAFWSELDDGQRESLLAQLSSVDFPLMQALFAEVETSTDWAAMAAAAESPPGIRLAGSNAISEPEARAAGEDALRGGKVGVVLVAGGQGSRLGFPHPKGMYPIGPVSNRTLFEMLIDTHQAVAHRYATSIPLFLMTSPATDAETRAYFASRQRLGFAEDDLRIFCQGTMPAVDAETGRLLLEAKSSLFLSPDGHGGALAALDRSGSLDQIASRGIEYLFYYQVDNPLVMVADPVFIGYHILAKSEMSTQVICKQDPHEKVGNVAKIEGKIQVIEYSDLPAEAAERRNADGSLTLWAGSIAVHVFDNSFLRRMAADAHSLPFHRASKRVPCISERGERVEPEAPNAIKFEKFIFDLLPHAKNAIVVEVDEARAFAPLKNASGAPKDTAEYVQAALMAEHRRWLDLANVRVAPGVRVEVSPHFALNESELARRAAEIGPINQDVFLV